MSDKKELASSSSELAAELERIEHAKKIVIEVLDKGILSLSEAGSLAIDLGRESSQNTVCGCKGKCNCHDVCPCPNRDVIEDLVQPGQG